MILVRYKMKHSRLNLLLLALTVSAGPVLWAQSPDDDFDSAADPATVSPLHASPQPEAVPTYILEVADEISLEVFGESDLSVRQRIDQDGMIVVPLVGRMQVAGQPVFEVEDEIERAFIEQRYLREPRVTIVVHSFNRQEVTILGEVRRPGTISLPPGEKEMDILRAIARAGDFTDIAKLSEVTIRRIAEDGQTRTLQVDLRPYLEERNAADRPPVMVQAGDAVYIPERLF